MMTGIAEMSRWAVSYVPQIPLLERFGEMQCLLK